MSDPEIRLAQTKSADDRLLFLGVFFVGTFAVLAAKSIIGPGSSRDAAIVPLFIALAFQCMYWGATSRLERFRLREDRAGDSYYYLGLLYTLVSLAHTLWVFASTVINDDTSNVVSGFGIALATTIFGLFQRVLVQQFRTDVVEVEHQARNSLVEAANELRDNLFGIITDMNAFRQSLKVSVEESLNAAASVASDAMTEAAKKFTSEIDGVLKRMDETFAKFAGSAQVLSDRSDATVQALASLTEKIEKIEPPSNVVEMVFGPARDGMREAAASVKEAASSQKKQLERLGQLVELSIVSTTALEGKTKSISSGLDSVGVAITGLEKLVASSGIVLTTIEATSQRLNAAMAGAEAIPQAMRTTLEGLARDLDQSAKTLAQRQKEAADLVSGSVKTLADVSGRHTQALEGQLKTVEAVSQKIIDGVVSIANRVAERLS